MRDLLELMIDETCTSCKHNKEWKCKALYMDIPSVDFTCDFYERKRSGAYRRKRAKLKRRAE